MPDRVGEKPGPARGRASTRRPRVASREIRALASLLGDDDEKIVAMVWDNLLRIGPRALPHLRALGEDADPRTRLRARHVTMRIQAHLLERRFRRLAARREGEFDLETGLTLVAQIEYPQLRRAAVEQMLDELADGLRPSLSPRLSPRQRVAALNRYLFQDLKLRGDRDRYQDPDNSFIHRVIERRRGIPVSLAALMILVGRRLDMPLYGVSLPKNFLVRYRDQNEEIFVDPFGEGRILSREECARILTSEGYYVRKSFVSDFLSTASARDMVIRMLRNLILTYSKLQDRARVRRLIRYVDILRSRERAR